MMCENSSYNMGHDAEFVQRRLSVEEDNVSIFQVPFHNVTNS